MPVTDTTRHLSRAGNPRSSREAATRHEESGERTTNLERVIHAVQSWPGLTGRELASRMHEGLDTYEVRRRLSDALALELVRQGTARRCAVANRSAVTWYPVQPTDAQGTFDLGGDA